MTLVVRDLVVRYPGADAAALGGVSLTVPTGTTAALVGESGSGKSTLARAVIGIVRAASGNVLLDGEDVTNATGRRLRALRGRVQLVFQDPHASLNPRMTIGDTVREAAAIGRAGETVAALLDRVELPATVTERFPHELSGGQLQRVSIARALAIRPEVLLLDEITAALDVSVQARILNLLREVRAELGVTCVYISHDLSIVRYISDHVHVLRHGAIVESGAVDDVFAAPRDTYTRELLAAVPRLGGTRWRTDRALAPAGEGRA